MIARLKRRFLTLTILPLFMFITGCTNNPYIPPFEGRIATFSLSTLSTKMPKVNVRFACEKMSLSLDLVERRAPDGVIKKRTALRSGDVVTIQVGYDNVRRRDKALTSQDCRYASHFLQKTATGFKSCRSTLSFIPEEGRHYEIYFGLVSGRCSVRALQVVYNAEYEQNEFSRVTSVGGKICP